MTTMDRRTQLLLSGAAVVVIVAGLRAAAGVLDPILMAAVIVACAAPLRHRLQARGVPGWIAMTITALTVVGGTLAFGGVVGYAAKALVEAVPQYQDQLTTLLSSGTSWLDQHGIDASSSRLAEMISPAKVISLSATLLSSVGSALSLTLLIVMLAIFLLLESDSMLGRAGAPASARALSPASQRLLLAIATDVQGYLWITLVSGVIYAAGVWLVLMLFGVDLPLLWAVVALVLSFVPGVGFIISLIPPFALGLLEFGPVRAVIVAAVLVVFNNVVDNVVKPRLMKNLFSMGPFVMFAAILFWSYVLGPIGALLAVPLTVAVQRVVAEA